jgi:hypothetical protein
MKLRTNQKPQSAGIARNGAKHDDILEMTVTSFQHAICDILTTDAYDGTFSKLIMQGILKLIMQIILNCWLIKHDDRCSFPALKINLRQTKSANFHMKNESLASADFRSKTVSGLIFRVPP